jgi:hypothetical protein
MTLSTDLPCPNCAVSAGRYCDGAEPCNARVAAAAELDQEREADAARMRARDERTVERVRAWLRARAAEVRLHADVAYQTESDEAASHLRRAASELDRAADELSLDVLPGVP